MKAQKSGLARGCFLLVMVLLASMGCGKKGPPVPYDATAPRSIQDLEGVVREGRVFLRWSLPDVTPPENGYTPATKFRILRGEVPLGGVWCEECPMKLDPLDALGMDDIEKFPLGGRRIVYEDPKVSHGHLYVYQVLSVGERGYESPPSNRAVIFWDAPPAAPGGLEGVAQDGETVLDWDATPNGEGYRIYRKRGEGRFEGDPVGIVGDDELSYRDTGLANGVEYRYTVRAVRRLGRTWLEGPSSKEISLTPEDLTPPAPPQGLLAVPLSAGIELLWQRNVDPDLLGYFVYRRDQESQQYKPLNGSPLEGSTYVDRTVIVGWSYEYVVTAVDGSPRRNESAFSESVSVKYLR